MSLIRRACTAAAGMTLVEVVAALVLLSVLGSAVLPVLIEARRAVATPAPVIDRDALEKFADDWLASKEGASITANAIDLERDWPTDAATATVRIRSVGAANDAPAAAGHVWLLFECAGATVIRCADVDTTDSGEER